MSPRVVEIELGSLDESPLPKWSPGSHIDLHLPGGLVRQYSLCDTDLEKGRWRVCVSHEIGGRGGSRAVHRMLAVGDYIEVSNPRNAFPLMESASYLFLAGGIGITPLRSMISEVARRGRTWSLHYGVSKADEVIHEAWLDSLGDAAVIYPADAVGFPAFKDILARQQAGTRVYACGPPGMLDAVRQAVEAAGTQHFHEERFSGRPIDASGDVQFDVELAQTGMCFTVDADETVIKAAERNGFEFPTSCEEGTCGSCLTSLLRGEAEHRDDVLTDQEREESALFVPCVSRARGGSSLVLDC